MSVEELLDKYIFLIHELGKRKKDGVILLNEHDLGEFWKDCEKIYGKFKPYNATKLGDITLIHNGYLIINGGRCEWRG